MAAAPVPDRRRGRAPDPRPARTRRRIQEALAALAAEDAEITVWHIARRAEVSRAAFYSHYADVEDVAAEVLIPEIPEPEDPSEPAPDRARRELHLLVDSLVDRRSLVRSSSRWKLTCTIHRSIIRAFAARYLQVLAEGDAAPDALTKERALFAAGGTLTVLMGHLDADPRVPCATIRRHAHEGVDRTLATLRELVAAGR